MERKSRYTCIVKLKNRKAATVRKQFTKEFNAFRKDLIKTMTYDNGVEMAQHKELTKQTGVTVYFAHPYASWEPGTNENTKGLIRTLFPKRNRF